MLRLANPKSMRDLWTKSWKKRKRGETNLEIKKKTLSDRARCVRRREKWPSSRVGFLSSSSSALLSFWCSWSLLRITELAKGSIAMFYKAKWKYEVKTQKEIKFFFTNFEFSIYYTFTLYIKLLRFSYLSNTKLPIFIFNSSETSD